MWTFLYPIVHDVLNTILIGSGGILLVFLVTPMTARILAKWFSPAWSRLVSSLLGLGIIGLTMKLVLDSTSAEGLALMIITAATGAFALGSSIAAEDVVAGISLFFAYPYEVGDRVSLAGGQEGKVTNISLFLITLKNEQGDLIYIRNSEVAKNSITKFANRPPEADFLGSPDQAP